MAATISSSDTSKTLSTKSRTMGQFLSPRSIHCKNVNQCGLASLQRQHFNTECRPKAISHRVDRTRMTHELTRLKAMISISCSEGLHCKNFDARLDRLRSMSSQSAPSSLLCHGLQLDIPLQPWQHPSKAQHLQ